MDTWEQLTCEHLLDCRVFQVYKKRFRHRDQDKQGDFYVLDCNDWVQVLALTPQQELIMVNQFRYGSKALSWEVPGGVIDDADSDPIIAGERELIEETGYAGKGAKTIGWVYANPAILTNRCHFVLVENCQLIAATAFDEHEDIAVERMPIDRVFNMARKGHITHSIALNALFMLQQHLTLK